MNQEPRAFPSVDTFRNGDWGMSLRDYFAAKCMVGLMSNPEAKHDRYDEEIFDIVADVSYQMADAMMRAREK